MFRQTGLATIESYPGAAQDILGIPRKRASLFLLRAGLSNFGISGEWLHRAVSHDELDSITAALVGVFFWTGRFEGLGDRDEGHLVVPELRTSPAPWLSRKVVGFSGPIGAGKTTAARFLEERGFAYARFSHVLEEMLRSRGGSISRETLQDFGEQIHQSPGQRWLCQQLVASLPKTGNIVIDGLRHLEDHAFLIEEYGPAFVHVHIDAPEETRQQRYTERGSAEDFAEAIRHPSERDVRRLAGLAHHQLSNAGALDDLRTKLLRILDG
jgi:dephospho-CoA kinase